MLSEYDFPFQVMTVTFLYYYLLYIFYNKEKYMSSTIEKVFSNKHYFI